MPLAPKTPSDSQLETSVKSDYGLRKEWLSKDKQNSIICLDNESEKQKSEKRAILRNNDFSAQRYRIRPTVTKGHAAPPGRQPSQRTVTLHEDSSRSVCLNILNNKHTRGRSRHASIPTTRLSFNTQVRKSML